LCLQIHILPFFKKADVMFDPLINAAGIKFITLVELNL